MVKVSRLLKDYADSGALNERLAVWGFVDPVTFLTKAGAVGVMFRLDGVDDACLDHTERQAIARRFEQALRQLDESFRVYQYLVKRPAVMPAARAHANPVVREALARRAAYFASKADALFEYDIYTVILYEGWSGARNGSSLRGLLVRAVGVGAAVGAPRDDRAQWRADTSGGASPHEGAGVPGAAQ